MSSKFFNRNIPDECHAKMQEFIDDGDDIAWVAFAPGKNRFSIVRRSGKFFNRNIPDECHQQMGELSKGDAKIVCVAFPPEGGFSIVNNHGKFFNRNIPDECHQQMGELSKGDAKIVCVAFPPQGGNRFSIVNNHGKFFNRNVPDECHQQMGELSKGDAKIAYVAFPRQGDNGFSVVNDQGQFFNRNIPDEAHMMMRFMSGLYGDIRFVAFDGDGDGWSVNGAFTKHEKVCDGDRCVTISDVFANLRTKLEGKVVGYACCVGGAAPIAFSHGSARTAADAPARLFLPSTKIEVASASKVLTALTAIRVLHKHDVSLDAHIEKHVPKDWKLDPHVASITFRELLSHRSGIKDYGNNREDYASLKKFFTQKVDATKHTKCQGSDVSDPPNPINPNDKSGCYSNYNFAVFRVLLPLIDGFDETQSNREAKLAAHFIKLVQRHVFEPVGVHGVDAKPPATGQQANAYAFSYKFPGSEGGHDWGDTSLTAGASSFYLAIDDIGKVLDSLNKNDGRILTAAQWSDMQSTPLGWDRTWDGTNNYRWLEKNGGWGSGGTTISTSIALFGSGVIGALFVNSDYSGNADMKADVVLHDAYTHALKPKS